MKADRVVSQIAVFLKIGEMTEYFYADGNNTVQKKVIMKIEGGITEVIFLCSWEEMRSNVQVERLNSGKSGKERKYRAQI